MTLHPVAFPEGRQAPIIAAEAKRILAEALHDASPYVSMPVPVVFEGRAAVAFFAAKLTPRPDGSDEDIGAPLATAILEWPNGKQLDLQVHATASAPLAGVRPMAFRGELDEQGRAILQTQFARLDGLFEMVEARYCAQPQRPPMDDGTRYLEQLEDLVPREPRKYYEALNPDFFRWVEGGR